MPVLSNIIPISGPQKIGMEPELTLRSLDLEPWRKKVVCFAQEAPLRAGRVVVSLRNKVRIPPSAMNTDGFGNVLAMPELIGKPCFGVATAFLRHGSAHPTELFKTISVPGTRCGRCTARTACVMLVLERVRSRPHLQNAVARWYEMGGRLHLATDKTNELAWQQVTEATASAVFHNSNDAAVVRYWSTIDSIRKRKDADRKNQTRLTARLARADAHLREFGLRWWCWESRFMVSTWDLKFARVIAEERVCRAEALIEIRHHPASPRWIKRLSRDACWLMASAWAARSFRVQFLDDWKRRYYPQTGAVAAIMIERGWNAKLAHKDLMKRIPLDLRRADRLERIVTGDAEAAIWRPFDVIAAL